MATKPKIYTNKKEFDIANKAYNDSVALAKQNFSFFSDELNKLNIGDTLKEYNESFNDYYTWKKNIKDNEKISSNHITTKIKPEKYLYDWGERFIVKPSYYVENTINNKVVSTMGKTKEPSIDKINEVLKIFPKATKSYVDKTINISKQDSLGVGSFLNKENNKNFNKKTNPASLDIIINNDKPTITPYYTEPTTVPIYKEPNIQKYTASKYLELKGKPSGYINEGNKEGIKEFKNGGKLNIKPIPKSNQEAQSLLDNTEYQKQQWKDRQPTWNPNRKPATGRVEESVSPLDLIPALDVAGIATGAVIKGAAKVAKNLERNITMTALNSKSALKLRSTILDKINNEAVKSGSAFNPKNLTNFENQGIIHGDEGTLMSQATTELFNSPAGAGSLRKYIKNRVTNKKVFDSNQEKATFYSPNRKFNASVTIPNKDYPVGKLSDFSFFDDNPISAGRTAKHVDNLSSNLPGEWEINPGNLSGDSYPMWLKILEKKYKPQYSIKASNELVLNPLGKHSNLSKLRNKLTSAKTTEEKELLKSSIEKELDQIHSKFTTNSTLTQDGIIDKDPYITGYDLTLHKKYAKGGKLKKFSVGGLLPNRVQEYNSETGGYDKLSFGDSRQVKNDLFTSSNQYAATTTSDNKGQYNNYNSTYNQGTGNYRIPIDSGFNLNTVVGGNSSGSGRPSSRPMILKNGGKITKNNKSNWLDNLK